MPLKIKKMFGKPFKKLFHRHCGKKTITSVDEEDTVDERTIEKVRRKLTCKKVGNNRIKNHWHFQNVLRLNLTYNCIYATCSISTLVPGTFLGSLNNAYHVSCLILKIN